MSSGAPKRPHDEAAAAAAASASAPASASASAASSKYPPPSTHEDNNTTPSSSYPTKIPPSSTSSSPPVALGVGVGVSNPIDYHPSYDMAPDARLPKLPRTDSQSRDAPPPISSSTAADRRSPLHSAGRIPSSSNDSHSDAHLPVPESRDSKDWRDHRIDNRDSRTELRDLYVEAKRDPQNAKPDKDARFEVRADDTKDLKLDREAHNNEPPKVDMKVEKESFGSASAQLNWKDAKEFHRGKRYSESSGGHLDSWHVPRVNPQGLPEVGKDGSTVEQRDYAEAHEAVAENKVDPKGDDRYKDKDRKRKDLKHREWGDRDKERSDRRGIMQAGNSSNDGKESAREEREADRWERERKDISKEREKIKEREKDHMKRESWNGSEKESLQSEKESGDGSGRMPDQENPPAEPKKLKDFDNWKNVEREAKDRRKERDSDMEGDRPEKRSRLYDKESDDGCADAEGTAEREKEAFNYGLQQRKRMLRPRGSPQMTNREPRFRCRSQDTEGTQAAGASGKSEVSSVIYKVGECMQDLIKLWKEFESSQSDKNGQSNHNSPTLEVRIPAEHVTATNRQVRGGQLWGTDVYTDDSDLVAVLMHTGYCRPTASPPPPAIQELRATIRVLPPQDSYTSMLRNNVRSRAWGAGIGCSFRVERCCIVKKGGGTIDLEPCLTHTSAVEPTLAPVAVERTMTTRAAASNALRQQRFVREVTIQYNLCNEPWIKYSISIVADKGLKKPLYTSARLKKGEVLYLETHSCRYELCFAGEKMVKATQSSQIHEESDKSHNHHPHSSNGEKNDTENILIDAFRWSRCKKPLPQRVMRSVGIPLPLEHVELLEENLDWEDVQWSQTGVWIAGKEYTLARVHFLSPS